MLQSAAETTAQHPPPDSTPERETAEPGGTDKTLNCFQVPCCETFRPFKTQT